MIINKTTCHVQTMSTHPNDNWMGDDWALVPERLKSKAVEYAPYCSLVWDDEELVDIIDTGRPPVPEPEPASEELLNIMLGGGSDE